MSDHDRMTDHLRKEFAETEARLAEAQRATQGKTMAALLEEMETLTARSRRLHLLMTVLCVLLGLVTARGIWRQWHGGC